MPNIPQVNVGGVTYKLKDAEAREQIANLKNAIGIEYAADFNDLAPSARPYAIYSRSDYLHAPDKYDSPIIGVLYVTEDNQNHFIWQMFVHYYSGRVSTRFKQGASGSWRDWVTLASEDLAPASDLNNLVINKTYTFPSYSGNNKLLNCPFESYGMLFVYKDFTSTLIHQMAINFQNGYVYTRIKVGSGSWRAWVTASDQFSPRQSIAGIDDYNNLTTNGIYTSLGGYQNKTNFPPADSSVGVFVVTTDPQYGYIYQTFIESYTGYVYTRVKTSSWNGWQSTKYRNKNIRILFVGNSMTQDAISYLPCLLKTYFPEIHFEFYMWYIGGATLADHYDAFINNTPCQALSVSKDTSAWANYSNTKTMSDVVSENQFDIVCLQEYFNYKSSYTDSDIVTWNNCKDYISTHYTGGNPLEFISLMHATITNDASKYALAKAGNRLILQKTISQDMIPVGIAKQLALNTAIGTLGDGHDLTVGDYTHAQEGLPSLLQALTAACWLLDKLGDAKSVYGCPLRMTTELFNTLSVPGANLGTGVITGTDDQNLVAQEVAIKAFKIGKRFVLESFDTDSAE